jgi:hypothetical protein
MAESGGVHQSLEEAVVARTFGHGARLDLGHGLVRGRQGRREKRGGKIYYLFSRLNDVSDNYTKVI